MTALLVQALLMPARAGASPVVDRVLLPYQFVALKLPVGLGVRLTFPRLESPQGVPERLTAALTNAHLFELGRPDPTRNLIVVTALRGGGRSDLFLELGPYEVTVQLTAVARAYRGITDVVFRLPKLRPAHSVSGSVTCHSLRDIARYTLRAAHAQRVLVRVRGHGPAHILVLRIRTVERHGSWVAVRFAMRGAGRAAPNIESITLLALTRTGRLIQPLITGWFTAPDPYGLRGVAVARIPGGMPRAFGFAVVTTSGQVQARW